MIINWYMTSNCNLKCNYCSNAYLPIKEDRTLSNQDLVRITDQISEFSKSYPLCLSISGGEPFSNPIFIQILQTLSEAIEIEEVFTNGTYLNEDIVCELAKLRITRIHVSLDALPGGNGNKNRVGLSDTDIRKLLVLLDKLETEKQKIEKDIPIVVLTPVLTAANKDELADMVEYCHKKVFGIDIQTLYAKFGRAREYIHLELSNSDELDSLIAFAEQVKKYPLIYANISDQPNLVRAYINKKTGKEIFPIFDARCEFMKNWPPYPTVCILSDGRLIPCKYDDRPFPEINLKDTSITEIFKANSGPFADFLTDLKNKDISSANALCIGCYFFKKSMCMVCPLPNPADLKHEKCPEVIRRDRSLYKEGIAIN